MVAFTELHAGQRIYRLSTPGHERTSASHDAPGSTHGQAHFR
jgi:hypothetical protein